MLADPSKPFLIPQVIFSQLYQHHMMLIPCRLGGRRAVVMVGVRNRYAGMSTGGAVEAFAGAGRRGRAVLAGADWRGCALFLNSLLDIIGYSGITALKPL